MPSAAHTAALAAVRGLVNATGVSHAGVMSERDADPAGGPDGSMRSAASVGETSRERLDAAFAATRRAAFLPEEVRDRWREDRPLALVHGMTNSQPSTVREMLRLLDVPVPVTAPRVLDVGSGSGWTTALLAHLVGSGGTVLGLEIEPDLVAFGRANLAAAQVDRARIEPAVVGVLGAPEQAPFDRILVSAMAASLPEELVTQLTPDGVLVVPVDGRMVRVRRRPGGEPSVERFGGYRFVPLR